MALGMEVFDPHYLGVVVVRHRGSSGDGTRWSGAVTLHVYNASQLPFAARGPREHDYEKRHFVDGRR